MRRIITAFSAAALCCILMVSGASAQAPCGPRDLIVSQLKQKYKEEPVATGLINTTVLMEVYASEAGTWTVTTTDTHGTMCIVLAGQAWDILPALKKRDRGA